MRHLRVFALASRERRRKAALAVLEVGMVVMDERRNRPRIASLHAVGAEADEGASMKGDGPSESTRMQIAAALVRGDCLHWLDSIAESQKTISAARLRRELEQVHMALSAMGWRLRNG